MCKACRLQIVTVNLVASKIYKNVYQKYLQNFASGTLIEYKDGTDDCLKKIPDDPKTIVLWALEKGYQGDDLTGVSMSLHKCAQVVWLYTHWNYAPRVWFYWYLWLIFSVLRVRNKPCACTKALTSTPKLLPILGGSCPLSMAYRSFSALRLELFGIGSAVFGLKH